MSYDYQIENFLKNNEHFMGCYAADDLPKNPPSGSCLIANYSNRNDGGSHWIGMKNLNTHNVQYFDSYGFEPDSDDMFLNTTTKFKEYLRKNSTNNTYKYNHINIQGLQSDVCGEYCCKFIKDGMPIENNRINSKWSFYLKSNSTDKNDKKIKNEIKIR